MAWNGASGNFYSALGISAMQNDGSADRQGASQSLANVVDTQQKITDNTNAMIEDAQKTLSGFTDGLTEFLGTDPEYDPQTGTWKKGTGLAQVLNPHLELNQQKTDRLNQATKDSLARRDEKLIGLSNGAKDKQTYIKNQTGMINQSYGNFLNTYGLTIDQAAALAQNPYDAIAYAEINSDRIGDKTTFLKQLQDPNLNDALQQYASVRRQWDDRDAGVGGEYWIQAMADAHAPTDAIAGISRDDRITALRAQDLSKAGIRQGESVSDFEARRKQDDMAKAFGRSGAAASAQAIQKYEDNAKRLSEQNKELKDRISQLENTITQFQQNLLNNKSAMYSELNNDNGNGNNVNNKQQYSNAEQQGYNNGSNASVGYSNAEGGSTGGVQNNQQQTYNGSDGQSIDVLENRVKDLSLLYAQATNFHSDKEEDIASYVDSQIADIDNIKDDIDIQFYDKNETGDPSMDSLPTGMLSRKQVLQEIIKSKKEIEELKKNRTSELDRYANNNRGSMDLSRVFDNNAQDEKNYSNTEGMIVSDQALNKEDAKETAKAAIENAKSNSTSVKTEREKILSENGYNEETGETKVGNVTQNPDGTYSVSPHQVTPKVPYTKEHFTLMGRDPTNMTGLDSLGANFDNANDDILNWVFGGRTDRAIFTTDDNSIFNIGKANGFFDATGKILSNVPKTLINTNNTNNKEAYPLQKSRWDFEQDVSVGGRVVDSPLTLGIGKLGKFGVRVLNPLAKSLSESYFAKTGFYKWGQKLAGKAANSYAKAEAQILKVPGFKYLAVAESDGPLVVGGKQVALKGVSALWWGLRSTPKAFTESGKGLAQLLGKGGDFAKWMAAPAIKPAETTVKSNIARAIVATFGVSGFSYAGYKYFQDTGEINQEFADELAQAVGQLTPDQKRQLNTKLFMADDEEAGIIKSTLHTAGHFTFDTNGIYDRYASDMYDSIKEKNGIHDTMLKLTDNGRLELPKNIMSIAHNAINGDKKSLDYFKLKGIKLEDLITFTNFVATADLDHLNKEVNNNSAPNADVPRDTINIIMPFLADAQAQSDQLIYNERAEELQNKLNDSPDIRKAAAVSATATVAEIQSENATKTPHALGNAKLVNAHLNSDATTAETNIQNEILQQAYTKGFDEQTYRNVSNLFYDSTNIINMDDPSAKSSSTNATGSSIPATPSKQTSSSPGIKPVNKNQIAFVPFLNAIVGEDDYAKVNKMLQDMDSGTITKITNFKNKYFDTNGNLKKGQDPKAVVDQFAAIVNNAFFKDTDLGKALKTKDGKYVATGSIVHHLTKGNDYMNAYKLIKGLLFLDDGQDGLDQLNKLIKDPNINIRKSQTNKQSAPLVRKEARRTPPQK